MAHLVIHPLQPVDVAIDDPRRFPQQSFPLPLIFLQRISVEGAGELVVVAQFSQMLHHVPPFHQGDNEVREDLAAFGHIAHLPEDRGIQAQEPFPLLAPEQGHQKEGIPFLRRQIPVQLRPLLAKCPLIGYHKASVLPEGLHRQLQAGDPDLAGSFPVLRPMTAMEEPVRLPPLIKMDLGAAKPLPQAGQHKPHGLGGIGGGIGLHNARIDHRLKVSHGIVRLPIHLLGSLDPVELPLVFHHCAGQEIGCSKELVMIDPFVELPLRQVEVSTGPTRARKILEDSLPLLSHIRLVVRPLELLPGIPIQIHQRAIPAIHHIHALIQIFEIVPRRFHLFSS